MVFRNPISIKYLIFLAFMNSLLWLSIYWNVDAPAFTFNRENDEILVKNLAGFSYLMVIDQVVNMLIGQVIQVPQTYPIFKREVSNNMYGASSYYFARTLVSMMNYFFYPFLLTLCMIWFIGLPVLNFTVVVGWCLDLLLLCLVGCAVGLTLGCIFIDGS